MNKIAVIEVRPGEFTDTLPLVVESLDGERRASIGVVLSEALDDEERAAFGVHLVEVAEAPLGKVVKAEAYARVDGVVIHVLDLEDAPVVVPPMVSPRQLQLALLGAGMLDQIEAFIASDSIPRAARISWKAATAYYRDDAMLNEMATHLTPPMSPAQIDQLFIAAAAIQ